MTDDHAKKLEDLLTRTFGADPAYHNDLKTRLLVTFLEALQNGATITMEDNPIGKRVIISEEGKPQREIGFHALPGIYN